MHFGRLTVAACAAMVATMGLGMRTTAIAADSSGTSLVNFDIKPQPLASALNAFAVQSHQQILFTPEIVRGKTSGGVSGALSPNAALEKLLSGSGLAFSHSADGMILVKPADAKGASTELDPTQAPSGAETDLNRSLAAARRPAIPTAGLEEIIVTAQKRPERLLTVPQPVTALSSADLQRANAVRLDDMVALVPGLNLISDREGETQIVLRGITTGTPVNSTVATYIDEIPFGSSTNAALGGWLSPDLDPSDLERVEVLRGPQGTLYGASSLGGVIKYVTAQPNLSDYQARIAVDGSTVDGGGQGYGVRVMGNAPLISDTLALRLSGYDRRDPGYIDDAQLGLRNVNRSDVDGGRAALLWKPTSQLAVNATAVIQDLKSNGTSDEDVTPLGNGLVAADGQYRQTRYTAEPLDMHYRLYSVTANYDMQWATLVSATGYSTLHQTALVDQTDAFGPLIGEVLGVPNVGFSVGSELFLHKITQEIRLESPESTNIEWRAGFFFTREHSDRNEPSSVFLTPSQSVIPLPEPVFFSFLDSHYTEYAGFGDLTYHFTPQFDVSAGVRYSDNRQQFGEVSGGLGAGATVTTNQDSSDNSTTFLVSPQFNIDDNNMVYARVASGYRPGGPNSVTAVEIAAGVPTVYKPDTLTDYDIGYKASLLDRRLTVDFSAFHINWRNIQIETDFSGITSSGNGGSARSDGLEASVALAPLGGLKVALNFAYTDAHLTENATGINGVSGDELPNVPKWSGALSADYDFAVTQAVSGFVGGGVHHVGLRESGFVTGSPVGYLRPLLPSYTTVDLRTGVSFSHYTLALNARNIGNARGFNNITSMAESGYQAPFTASVIQPRTLDLSFIAKFY